ncbi:11215_t:CDS:2 [Entrophospora sp. SA101]|nr:12995_t:CDS:2 [Entrophospora sp. SA101]CAJ0756807.1 11215_t:CDS:2 [Entrophospora sp. SA101]CAJ0838639.1 11700_t:CDS:2 [Entrophospora sp. SA101]CAJ0843000.1 1315_t:CDS:2 [Entrophospora sp. SA101]
MRVNVQKNTIDIFDKFLKYEILLSTTDDKKIVELNLENIKQEISKANIYNDGSKIVRKIIKEKQEIPNVEIYNGDCLSHALDLKQKGYNPLVLNMANADHPGGGYKYGARAQEENLFRRTNLFQYLEPRRDDWYPIPIFDGIYCPNATVIKANEQEGYQLLEIPETMSFVTVAALCRPDLVEDPDNYGGPTLKDMDKSITKQKIRTILNIGLDNNHDSIVLSAFGCGAFSNPPSTIAKLFHEVIMNEYFGNGENLPQTYKHISFAIFDDDNSKQWTNEGNFKPFQRLFGKGLVKEEEGLMKKEGSLMKEGDGLEKEDVLVVKEGGE